MKAWRMSGLLLMVFAGALLAAGQGMPIKKGATETSLWAGGGTGLGHETGFQFANAGLRLGKVLTNQHGSGRLRGNLEYAVDLSPLYLIFQDRTPTSRETAYGGAVSPFIVKWNFTSGKRMVPFAAAEGTAILTTKDVPAGDTSIVNFGSGIAGGVQLLRDDHHAVSFSGHLLHISNASIGNHNPSINIGLQFRVGYQWWR